MPERHKYLTHARHHRFPERLRNAIVDPAWIRTRCTRNAPLWLAHKRDSNTSLGCAAANLGAHGVRFRARIQARWRLFGLSAHVAPCRGEICIARETQAECARANRPACTSGYFRPARGRSERNSETARCAHYGAMRKSHASLRISRQSPRSRTRTWAASKQLSAC